MYKEILPQKWKDELTHIKWTNDLSRCISTEDIKIAKKHRKYH